MALYLQHSRIENMQTRICQAFRDELADGIIYGAKGDQPSILRQALNTMSSVGARQLFDPQYYIASIFNAADTNLKKYYKQYYTGSISPEKLEEPSEINKVAKEVVEMQVAWRQHLHRTISPALLCSSFDDDWARASIELAKASMVAAAMSSSQWPARPMLLSFAFAERALASRDTMNTFLDTITAWDPEGFYLVVAREDPNYNQSFRPDLLTNLLLMVHSLGRINKFEVICGYSDYAGILLRAAGASAFAVGWAQRYRKFNEADFRSKPSGGGGSTPNPRYSSAPLLNSILLSDLRKVHEKDKSLFREVLSGTRLDGFISGDGGPAEDRWNHDLDCLQHWEALKSLDRTITGDTARDVESMQGKVDRAIGLYQRLADQGLVRGDVPEYLHLYEWQEALAKFRAIARLGRRPGPLHP